VLSIISLNNAVLNEHVLFDVERINRRCSYTTASLTSKLIEENLIKSALDLQKKCFYLDKSQVIFKTYNTDIKKSHQSNV